MGAHDFNDLMNHYGHKIVVVVYGKREQYGPDPADTVKEAVNVAIECETCCEVLLDYDREELSAEDAGTKLIERWGKARDLLDDLLEMVSDPGDLADERWTTGLKQVLQQVKELVG